MRNATDEKPLVKEWVQVMRQGTRNATDKKALRKEPVEVQRQDK